MRLRHLGIGAICVTAVAALACGQCFTDIHEDPFPENGSKFGSTIASDGNWLVVGAPATDGPAGPEEGKVVVYRREGARWMFDTELRSADIDRYHRFGRAVAVCGDYLIATSRSAETPSGIGSGSVYIFRHADSNWKQIEKLGSIAPDPDQRFGWAVCLRDGLLAVSEQILRASAAHGTVELYRIEGDEVTYETTLDAGPARADYDYFGDAISIDAGRIGIGAWGRDEVCPTVQCDAGAVYVFEEISGTWQQTATLFGSGPELERFGWEVSLLGDRLVASAPREGVGSPGAAYVFEHDGTVWNEVVRLQGPPGVLRFGERLTQSAENIVVGSANRGVDQFRLVGSTWEKVAQFYPFWSELGQVIALDGDELLAGDPGWRLCSGIRCKDFGAVYSYRLFNPTACAPDMDGDGVLTFFDFLAFMDAFTRDDPAAEFDCNAQRDLFDFLAFQNAFAAGC